MKKIEVIKVCEIRHAKYEKEFMPFDCETMEKIDNEQGINPEDIEILGFIKVDNKMAYVVSKVSNTGYDDLWTYDIINAKLYSDEEEIPMLVYFLLEYIDDVKRVEL